MRQKEQSCKSLNNRSLSALKQIDVSGHPLDGPRWLSVILAMGAAEKFAGLVVPELTT